MRLEHDESPRAVLRRVSQTGVGEDLSVPQAAEPAAVVGAPFFRMIDLPPLAGAEDDARPMAVVAGDPWRPMRVWAGADGGVLTDRGVVRTPATVGVLTAPLGPGLIGRWDEVGALRVRIEGRAPESRSAMAVLAGGNAVAVETGAGWEVVQFRTAELVGPDQWRLSGLLRGQQGTEAATAAGAPTGALVVMLEQTARVDSARAERGLPLIWRAAPDGGPAGGVGAAETAWAPDGVHDRPWAQCQLRSTRLADGGRRLSWIARSRRDGDRWEGEVAASDPLRFRVWVMRGATMLRSWEVEGGEAVYSAAHLAEDFPEGLGPDAAATVAQWGERYGAWGLEARLMLA